MLNGASDRIHRIKLYRPVQEKDGYGGQNCSYELYKERWAQVMPPTFREQQAMGAPVSRETITIEIRPADKNIQRGWRISWGKDMYNIRSVDNTYRERTLVVAQFYNVGE